MDTLRNSHMDLYRQNILEHYKHPHNFGHMQNADVVKTFFNSACGDKIIMELKFEKKSGIVENISFSGEGCAISQASASLLTDEVKGKSVEAVLKFQTQHVLKLLNTALTPSRMKCALLPLEAIQKCILEGKTKKMV